MKKLLAAIALTAACAAAPAMAADVGVSIRIGDPGFYGVLDIGNAYRPRVVHSQPVVITRSHRRYAPVYLRVPRAHYSAWGRYCGRYGACARPVYFVRDEWYRDVYAPGYRRGHDYRHDDRRDRRHDRRHERRDDRRDYRDDRRGDWRDGRRDDRRDDRRDHRHDWRAR